MQLHDILCVQIFSDGSVLETEGSAQPQGSIPALSQWWRCCQTHGARPVFTVKGKIRPQYWKRRQSTLTSQLNVCLLLTFPEEPHWAAGKLWYCVYIYNPVKELAGNSLRNINNVSPVMQKETEAVICKCLMWDLNLEPSFQSLGVL